MSAEEDLRKSAIATLKGKIASVVEMQNSLQPTSSLKKKLFSVIGQDSQEHQLKLNLQKLLKASENVNKPLSGKAIAEKMNAYLLEYLRAAEKKKSPAVEQNRVYQKFLGEIKSYLACIELRRLLRNYANDRYGYAQKHFFNIISRLTKSDKNYPSSKALDLRTKTGDFFAVFYPDPAVEERDQLVIDTFNEYSQVPSNKKTELYAIGASMAHLAAFQVLIDKMASLKRSEKNDPPSLQMGLKALLSNLKPKYDQMVDPNNGLLKQIQDPLLRKQLTNALHEMMGLIIADLPNEVKETLIEEKKEEAAPSVWVKGLRKKK